MKTSRSYIENRARKTAGLFFAICIVQYANSQPLTLDIYNTTNTIELKTNSFTTVAAGKGGHIWAGTNQQGLYRFNGRIWEQSSQILTKNTIADIKPDKSGGIWIAQYGHTGAQAITGGVNYFPDSTFKMQFFSSSSGLPSRNARSIFIDTNLNNGATDLPFIWSANYGHITAGVSSPGGLGQGLYPSTPFFRTFRQGLDITLNVGGLFSIGGSSTEIWGFASSNFGRSQILRYNPVNGNNIGFYDNTNTPPGILSSDFNCRAIYFDSKGRKWLGMATGGGLVVFEGDQWTKIRIPYPATGNISFYANAITGDKNGNVYMGTSEGLLHFKGGSVEDTSSFAIYTTANGLPSNNIRFVSIDKYTGNILIATDNGIAIWRQTNIELAKYDIRDHVLSNGSIDDKLDVSSLKSKINGVSTDGNSRMLIAIKSDSETEFNIISGKPTDGTLSLLGSQQTESTKVTCLPDNNGFCSVIYRAPDGYGNLTSNERKIVIQAVQKSNPNVRHEAKVKLLTPPIVMVHGMWSDPEVWKTNGFETYLKNNLPGFNNIQLADYSFNSHLTFDPKSNESYLARASISNSVKQAIKESDERGIVSSQVDIICHSLGGLQARSFAEWQYDLPKTVRSTFGSGYIHKLITIGTPHKGSPLGPILYNKMDNLLTNIPSVDGVSKTPFSSLFTLVTGNKVGSVHRDFNTSISENNALMNISASDKKGIKKVHAIVGIAGTAETASPLEKFLAIVTQLRKRTLVLNVLFLTDLHDLIVGEESQKGGLKDSRHFTMYSSTAHSNPPGLEIAGYTTETSNPKIFRRAAELLTSNNIEQDFAPSFPAPIDAAYLEKKTENQLAEPATKNDTSYIRLKNASRRIQVDNKLKKFKVTFDKYRSAEIFDAILMIRDIGWFNFPDNNNQEIEISLPGNFKSFGTFPFVVIARNTDGEILVDTSTIIVQPEGTLQSFEVYPNSIIMDSLTKSANLRMISVYVNGSDSIRYFTDIPLEAELTTKHSLLKIGPGGTIEALAPGADTVSVNYRGKNQKIFVSIENSFSQSPKLSNRLTLDIGDKKITQNIFVLRGESESGTEIIYENEKGPVRINGDVVTLLDTGFVTIKAVAKESIYFEKSSVVTKNFRVIRDSQFVAFDQMNDTLSVDTTYEIKAISSSSLPVQLAVSGGNGKIINGNMLSVNGSGTIEVKAIQSGNKLYEPAETIRRFFVRKRIQLVSIDSITDKIYTDPPIALRASSSAGLPVQFRMLSGPGTIVRDSVRIQGTGVISIRAYQAGDSRFDSAYADRRFTVRKASQTVQFDSIPALVDGDSVIYLKAKASSGLPVRFILVSGSGTLANDQFRPADSGFVTIRAEQGGNDNFNAANPVSRTFKIGKRSQTIQVDTVGEKTFGDAPFELKASSGSGLPVTYVVVSGPGSLNGNMINITGAGSLVIKASQPGNQRYLPAKEVLFTIVIRKAKQDLKFDLPDRVESANPFTLPASGPTGIPVNYTLKSGRITLNQNNATITGPGKVTLQITNPGNQNYLPYEGEASFCINPMKPGVITADSISCLGNQTIQFTRRNQLTYQWSIPNGVILTENNSSLTLNWGRPGLNQIQVQASVEGCNSEPQSAYVRVYDQTPKPTITVKDGILLTSSSETGNRWYYNGVPLPNQQTKTITATKAGKYTLEVDGICGISAKSEAIEVKEDALKALLDEVKIYPNPNNGQFFIRIPDAIQEKEITVFDANGKILYQKKTNESSPLRMDAKNWPKGTYLIWVRVGDESTVRKVTIY